MIPASVRARHLEKRRSTAGVPGTHTVAAGDLCLGLYMKHIGGMS